MDTKFGYNLDRYEFWGYLIPGLLILLLVWRFWGEMLVRFVNFSSSSWESVLWVLVIFCIAYVIGIILQRIFKMIFIEYFKIFCDVTYPINKGKDDRKYGICFSKELIKEIHRHYTLGEDKLMDKCNGLHKNIYDLCYNSKPVIKNPLIPVYLARATMLRNLFLVSILTFILYSSYLILSYLFTLSIEIGYLESFLLIVLSGVSAWIFWEEASRLDKHLYKTVFITWWENYHRE